MTVPSHQQVEVLGIVQEYLSVAGEKNQEVPSAHLKTIREVFRTMTHELRHPELVKIDAGKKEKAPKVVKPSRATAKSHRN